MKKTLLLYFVFLAALQTAWAQERTVTGRVTDHASKQGLPGVTVLVKGTQVGTATNVNGEYSLSVPTGGTTLVFSFIGYTTIEKVMGNSGTVDLIMEPDARQLSEVVVTGYSTISRQDVTGAIASVKGEKLQNVPVQSLDQALSGKMAGVNITMPNGVLNNPPVFRVRGFNSISLSSYPLVVVDGIPVFTGDVSSGNASSNGLGDINPSDIESIDILKDAAASAIYGSRAANGVVVITTKKGQQGKTKVNYDGWVSVSQARNLPELLNAEEFVLIKNEARANARPALAPGFFLQTNPDGSTVDTDWYDYAYRKGVSQNHNLSFSGANATTTYYVSAGFTDQQGFIRKNDFSRKSGRANIDHQLNKIFKVGANFTYSTTFGTAPSTGSLPGSSFATNGLGRLAFVLPPNVSPYNPDGTYNMNGNALGLGANTVATNYPNMVVLLDKDYSTTETNRVIGNFYGQIEPLKGLTYKMSYGLDNLGVENVSFVAPLQGDGFAPNGSSTNIFSNNKRWNWVNTLGYTGTFAEKHNLSVLGGFEEQYTKSDSWGANRQGVSDPFIEVFQGSFGVISATGLGQSENAFRSIFSSLNYNYGHKYYVTGSFRRDGYSGLAAGHKYGNFGGASVGYAISEENFYKNLSFASVLTSLKVRASYGEVGNINIGAYPALSLYGTGLYGSVPIVAYGQAGNPDLRWESSKKTDYGISFDVLDGKIGVDIDYYNNDINDLILNAPQAPSKGIPGNSIAANIGSMFNKGVEISIQSTNISSDNFTWTSNFNFSTNKNRVTELVTENSKLFGTTSLETANVTMVGKSLGSLFVVRTDGVNPANGRMIFINRNDERVQFDFSNPVVAQRWTYVDRPGGEVAPAIDATLDGVVYANAIPTYFGGFDNDFKYKNFDLNLAFTYSGGNKIYYGSEAGLRDQRFWQNEKKILNRWTEAGQITNIPRVVYGDNTSNGSAIPQAAHVYDGDFIKLKNVAFGYKLPTSLLSKAGIASVRMYVQATNLLVITDYPGPDPEISVNGNSNLAPGVDRNSVPLGRTFSFGLNIGF